METVPVKISEIRVPDRSEINEKKIQSLINSPDSLSSLLHSKTDPVALLRDTYPYEVHSGRHRVYLAAQRGIQVVPAVFT